MSQELNNDQVSQEIEIQQESDSNSIIAWWNEQSFDDKALFNLDESGTLTLTGDHSGNGKERVIATIAPENADGALKNLQDKFQQFQAKITEAEAEWVALEDKLKMADKVAQIKESFLQLNAIGNFDKLAQIIGDWEKVIHELTEENYNTKLKLTEMAESLAESSDFKEAALALRDIGEKWKQTGFVDKHRNDKLWNRIEAARKAFHDRKRQHHEEEEKDLLVNLDLKIDLVEQAESIANSKEWKKTTETFHRLTEEWKRIGHTLNKKNEELWQRFLAAKSVFFERKRAHFSQIQVEQEGNLVVKTALVEKAEALRDSTEWNATAQAYASLMEEWKKTGRVPQEKGDELWKRFTEAQEQFFSAKKQHTDAIRAIHDSNYEQKAALLARAEQIKNSSRWGDVTAEMNELLDEWKKIGPIAREHGNKMWEDFIGARKYFFARKDANRDERKQYYSEQKVVRAEQAKGLVLQLQDEIKEEEEKLVDFRSALENITPGKKAAELKAHLEKLISDSTKQIKRLQEKYEAMKNERVKEEKQGKEEKQKQGNKTAEASVPKSAETAEQKPAEALPEEAPAHTGEDQLSLGDQGEEPTQEA